MILKRNSTATFALLACLSATALTGVVSTITTSASAQTEPTPGDKDAARRGLDEGDRLRKEGKLKEALAAYRAAAQAVEVPSTVIEVAKTLEALDRLVEAKDTYIKVSHLPVNPNEGDAIVNARTEAKAKVEALAVAIPVLRFNITIPAGVPVKVQLNGDNLPDGAHVIPRSVDPGTYMYNITAPGYKTVGGEVTLGRNGRKQLDIEMMKETNPLLQPNPPGMDPDPGGGVVPGPVPGGGDDGGDTGGGSAPVLAITGFAIAGVGIVVGSILGIITMGHEDALDKGCVVEPGPDDKRSCNATLAKRIGEAETSGTISTIGFAIGGAGIVVGIIGLLTHDGGEPSADATSAITVTPLIGPGFVGVNGTF